MTRSIPARSLVTPTFVQLGKIEKWLDGGKAVVAEFEDEDAAGLQMLRGLRDQFGVEFVAFFAAVEGKSPVRGRGLRALENLFLCDRRTADC